MEETEDATLVERPVRTPAESEGATRVDDRTAAGTSPSRLGVGSTGTSATATIALREEQGARARVFLRLASAVSLLTMVAIQTPARRAPGYWATMVGLVGVVVFAAYLVLDARRRETIDDRKMPFFGFVCGYTLLAAIFHVGVFSPAVIAMFVGVYYFGLGDSRVGAWLIFVMGSVGWGAMSLVSVTGIVALDDPIFAIKPVERIPQYALILVVEAFFALTFWLAATSRKATLEAMARVEHAHRQIRQRDALLDEARADLDRAMDAGRVGRFTEQPIGSFLAEDVIGRGAMGEVYRGRHATTGENAAIKVLHHYMIEDKTHLDRFFREAQAAGAAKSANVVRVLESGTAADGSPYLAMELLEGHDLGHHLREHKRLGIKAALDLVTQVADGLSAVHDAGIVHRDLKPQNIFRARSGLTGRVWKILDFGVASLGAGTSNLTQGAAIGTPSYMAPEQARGEVIDHRSDVFALGVIAYRALTGRPAFTGPDSMSTMYNVVHVQPVQPSSLVKLPVDVDRVLALALAKDPARRLSSASTLAAALKDSAREGLDPRFRSDADALIADCPWGSDDAMKA